MTKKDNFVICGKIERKLMIWMFNLVGIEDFRFSPADSNEPYDFLFQLNRQRVVGEIKVRDAASDTYPDWIIEKPKYDSLIKLGLETNSTPLYINFFTDSYVRVWAISKLPTPRWERKSLPSTTVAGKRWVEKIIGYLPSEDSFTMRLK